MFNQNFAFGEISHRVTVVPQMLWKTPECIPALVTQEYLCRCIVTLCVEGGWHLIFGLPLDYLLFTCREAQTE